MVAALSDTGRVRQTNQDQVSVRLAPELPAGFDGLLMVADGMGGEQGGAVASQLTVNAVAGFFAPDRIEPPDALDDQALLGLLDQAIADANQAVYRAAAEASELRGMGTTCTVALTARSNVYIGHVGDSRVYLIRDGQPFPLTTDHSWVAGQVQRGVLTAEQADQHPDKNLLLRAVGPSPRVEIDTVAYPLREHDLLVLCSDGLTNMVAPHEIAALARGSEHPRDICSRLVDLANERGGLDNISAVVARPLEVQPATESSERVRVTQPLPAPSRPHNEKTFLNFLFKEPFFTIWFYGLPGLGLGVLVMLIVRKVIDG